MLANRIRMATFKDSLPEGYVLATDDDFSGTSNGDFRYIGSALKIAIPHVIKGVPVTSYSIMFGNNIIYDFSTKPGQLVEGVVSNNTNVTDMSAMFYRSKATTLDLSRLNTSKVTDMSTMFHSCAATTLDLSRFNTSSVTNMSLMFYGSKATMLDLSSFDTSSVTNMRRMFMNSATTTLDLSSFDTSNVTDMERMFEANKATTLDLSSFDTSNVTNMAYMFNMSGAKTIYARTQADANRFKANAAVEGVKVIVKP